MHDFLLPNLARKCASLERGKLRLAWVYLLPCNLKNLPALLIFFAVLSAVNGLKVGISGIQQGDLPWNLFLNGFLTFSFTSVIIFLFVIKWDVCS